METLEQRQAIRDNYSEGRREAKARLEVAAGDKAATERLVEEGAMRMLSTDGLDYNLSQGFWHTVSDEPLDIVRKRIHMETKDV